MQVPYRLILIILLAIVGTLRAEFPVDMSDVILKKYEVDGNTVTMAMEKPMSEGRTVFISARYVPMSAEDRIRILGYSKLIGKRVTVRIGATSWMSRGGVWLVELAGSELEMVAIPDDGYREGIGMVGGFGAKP